MAVRLERKIFTCFKWFVILIPLFIMIGNFVTHIFKSKADLELANNSDYVAWYDAFYGVDYYDDMYQLPDFLGEIIEVHNNMRVIVPKFTYRKGVITRTEPLFCAIYDLALNPSGNFSNTNIIYNIMFYLSYVVTVEVIFMALYFFRFFIHFFINLFERKQDI